MTASLLTLTVLITTTLSKTFICNDLHCDFGTCNNNKCDSNIYICASSSNHCVLDCQNCNNITIISSAQDTEILCDSKNSCNKISIEIQSESLAPTDHNSLLLTCSHSTSCTDINVSCNNNHNLCQCKDYDDVQCNTNVNGDFSLWHSHPDIIRKSIIDAYNHSNQTIPFTSTYDMTTSVQSTNMSTSYSNVAEMTDDNLIDDDAILTITGSAVQNENGPDSNTDVEAARHFIIIMFGLLFLVLVCLVICFYIKKCFRKYIENRQMDETKLKKQTIDSCSPKSQPPNLVAPRLGISIGSTSVVSQASLDSHLSSPKLNLQGSESVISVSSLNISNENKSYGECMVMGV